VPYIVCKRKKNKPRISALVCMERCRFKKTCPEYLEFLNATKDKEDENGHKGLFMERKTKEI